VRNLVIDFDLTIIWPLILLALFFLVNSVFMYIKSSADCKAAMRRIKGTFSTREEGEEFLEWGRSRCGEQRDYKYFIVVSASALGVLCAAMLMADSWKVFIAYQLWFALSFVSTVSFIVTIPTAWHYAKKSEWLKAGICLLAMLMAAACAEHFFHQRINAGHVVCPGCSDENDRPDEN